MVLRRGAHDDVVAVSEADARNLGAGQEGLDDASVSSGAEEGVGHNFFDGRDGFFGGGGNDHALARCKAGRLHNHTGGGREGVDVCEGFVDVGEVLVGGCGDGLGKGGGGLGGEGEGERGGEGKKK